MDGSINFIGSLSGSIDEGGGGGGNVYDVKVKTSLNYESVVNEDDKTAYIDLSGYATKSELSGYVTSEALTTILNNYVTDSELSTTLSDYVTDNELSTELTSYQPKLTAGENITINPVTNVISASGGGAKINYSTTEQDTGLTWIDGKHIYQKTIIETLTSAVSHFSLPNVDTYIKADALLYNNGKTYTADLPYWESSNFFASKQYDYTNETLDIVATQNVANSYPNLIATIYYTKSEV